MEKPVPARSFLTHTKVGSLTAGRVQDVVVLRQDTTVELALKTLSASKILSAPVVTRAGNSKTGAGETEGEHGDIVGFLDLKDVLGGFLKELDLEKVKDMKMLQRLRYLESKGQEFAYRSIKDLQTGGDGGFVHRKTAEAATLRELIHDQFLYPAKKALHGGSHVYSHVHRVALFDNDGNIVSIISQTDLVRFLLQNYEKLGELCSQTVQQLGWADRQVISVPPEKPAIEVMELMTGKYISAVAVVSSAGRLIGNFSVSELRTIMSEHFGSLALPVGEFLALEHGTEYDGYTIHSDCDMLRSSSSHKFAKERQSRVRPRTPGQEVGQELIVCPASTTFKEVMGLVVHNRIHRLYILDIDNKPQGIVTLTDILAKVLETNL